MKTLRTIIIGILILLPFVADASRSRSVHRSKRHYWKERIPDLTILAAQDKAGALAKSSDGYDSKMLDAAEIAESRAHHRSRRSCWRRVKEALLEANVVDSYPKTAYAKQAGVELLVNHGFRRLAISDPFSAPIGAILVYGGRGAGHVEFRTESGFVSDFESPTPSKRPLLGVFVKPS